MIEVLKERKVLTFNLVKFEDLPSDVAGLPAINFDEDKLETLNMDWKVIYYYYPRNEYHLVDNRGESRKVKKSEIWGIVSFENFLDYDGATAPGRMKMRETHEYSEYKRNGVTVCHTCDPLGENNRHRPLVKKWLEGKINWVSCLGENVPSRPQGE